MFIYIYVYIYMCVYVCIYMYMYIGLRNNTCTMVRTPSYFPRKHLHCCLDLHDSPFFSWKNGGHAAKGFLKHVIKPWIKHKNHVKPHFPYDGSTYCLLMFIVFIASKYGWWV
jgi:hypothetical protein